VCKYLLDHRRVFNTGDYLDSASAFFASCNIDIEYSLEALCPGHRGMMLYRRSFISVYLAFGALASFRGCHQDPMLAVWRERREAIFRELGDCFGAMRLAMTRKTEVP